MKLFCAIAMCSVAWADMANLDALVTSCSDASRIGRLRSLQSRLRDKTTNMVGYERALRMLSPYVDKVTEVLMEHEIYQDCMRQLIQMLGLIDAANKITTAEGLPTGPEHQITIKQFMNETASIIYLLSEIIAATEVLEKDLERGDFKALKESGELTFKSISYEEFADAIQFLGTNKILLLFMMKDLQDIRTPLVDLTTENTCSTKEAYRLSGMTYIPEAPAPKIPMPASAGPVS
jgi:hypothetical protein